MRMGTQQQLICHRLQQKPTLKLIRNESSDPDDRICTIFCTHVDQVGFEYLGIIISTCIGLLRETKT